MDTLTISSYKQEINEEMCRMLGNGSADFPLMAKLLHKSSSSLRSMPILSVYLCVARLIGGSVVSADDDRESGFEYYALTVDHGVIMVNGKSLLTLI